MIVLDSSAIVAIMLEEEEEEAFSEILGSNPAFVGAPTLVETRLVVDARLPAAGDLLNKFLHDSAVTIVPFDAAMFVAAADAFTRYGRGRHRARLTEAAGRAPLVLSSATRQGVQEALRALASTIAAAAAEEADANAPAWQP